MTRSSVTPPVTESSGAMGIVYAILAYGSWGLFPIYWKWFGDIPALEVLSHRMIWSMAFVLSLLAIQSRLGELRKVMRSPRTLQLLVVAASLLACNWGLYIYGVNTERVVETSLGYFINPLLTVVLGMVVLKERLNRVQWMAVGLATIGVAHFIWDFGQAPWIAFGLALSFGFYGLVRKVVAIAPLVGLAVETLVIAPFMLLLVIYWGSTGVGHFGTSWLISLLCIGAGVVTSMPLLWFNNATKRLRLSTMGFFQYIAPSLQLMLGVFLYQEPFTRTHAITFGCIWVALAMYSADSWWNRRQAK
ncbi:MAG: EamA family transporter RarD [Cyanothece sp. SIO2G6]|nr:EamA family transporter RarD [Cyanothece sp. SIO2G6]